VQSSLRTHVAYGVLTGVVLSVLVWGAALGRAAVPVLALLLGASVATWATRLGERRRHRARKGAVGRRVLRALALALHPRDRRSRARLRRTLALAEDVGLRLGLGRAQRRALSDAAIVAALWPRRPRGRQDDRCFAALGRVAGCAEVVQILRARHERFDGTGPRGLRGDAIPLGARILAAVARPEPPGGADEKTARPEPPALDRESGRALDPRVVEALREAASRRATAATEADPERGAAPGEDRCGGSVVLAERELDLLHEIARAQAGLVDRDEPLAVAARLLAPLVPHRALAVYRVDEHGRALLPRFAAGPEAAWLDRRPIPLGEGVAGRAALERRAVRPADPRDGRACDPQLSIGIAAPLSIGDRCTGVLALFAAADRCFSESERRVVGRVAARLAACLAGGETAPVTGGGLTDPATGLPSARLLRIEAARRGSVAGETPAFGLIALRLLGVSAITERRGFDPAERVIGRVARRLARACAPSETVARFGPDVFVVLTDGRDAEALHWRWRALALAVERPLAQDGVQSDMPVRFAAAHAVHGRDGETLDDLLATLDARLVLADRDGRRVVAFRAPAAAGWAPAAAAARSD
jgi:GGDEF domain-containing protein/putative methionine-R-sulfoxide reductase with GAF domain